MNTMKLFGLLMLASFISLLWYTLYCWTTLKTESPFPKDKIHGHHEDIFIHRAKLVDVPKISRKTAKIRIFWINKPVWISVEKENGLLADMCPYTNCKMTDASNDARKDSAIVFSAQHSLSTRLKPENKPKDQVWIIFQMESPALPSNIKWFNDPVWSNKMNWTWGYRLDSDVFRPYGTLITRKQVPEKNYSELFRRKTKMAAWVFSNCDTPSKRERYVKKLIQYGVHVDIYGRCFGSRERGNRTDIERKLNKDYKFYLSFENSLCKDYVTEKFFYYYQFDVVLVTRGGINYNQHFDKTSFINTNDFPSAKELANFMLKVNSSELLYTSYIRNKDKYEALLGHYLRGETNCRLCEKLNHKERHYNVYDNISEYLFKDACLTPNDLS